jgi:hypothetical protein
VHRVVSVQAWTGHGEVRLHGTIWTVGVHGSDTWVVLLWNIVRSLLARSLVGEMLKTTLTMEDGRWSILRSGGNAVSVDVCWVHAVAWHWTGTVLSKGVGTVHVVAMHGSLSRVWETMWPVLAGMLRGRWRVSAVRVGRITIVQFRRVNSALMRSALMLDHGGLSAEALQASLVSALVWSLASVNAAVTGKTRRLGTLDTEPLFHQRTPELTSENLLPHPMCWHWCGFSPVWVRI